MFIRRKRHFNSILYKTIPLCHKTSSLSLPPAPLQTNLPEY